MRALEINAEYFGISRLQLMENAGNAVASQIASRFKPDMTRIAVFCGLGGNGGDGFVAARHLLSQGFQIEILLAGKPADITSEETRTNFRGLQYLAGNIDIHEIIDSSLIPNLKADVIVDALLGIGLKGAPRPPTSQLIAKINAMKGFKVAVDVPSGINSDTGEALGATVKADLTVTFHKPKQGLRKANKYVGELLVAGIGLPRELDNYVGAGDVEKVAVQRSPTAHKGDSGRLLVIGGSAVFSGAPALVALAAYRAGVDLVYVAAPTETAYAISSMSADLITIKLDGDHFNARNITTLAPYLEKATAVAMGPGLGLHKDTKDTVRQVMKLIEDRKIPLLLDADALKAFAEFKHKFMTPTVLTPHHGEYRILTHHDLKNDVKSQITDVRKTSKELGAIVLLKGPTDIISDGERYKLNFTGNPGMTVGGTGDVLSGIVAGFMAQGFDSFDAAVAGAFVNGAAGDFVASNKGFHMVASDLLEWIPRVLDDPMSHAKVQKLG